MEPKGKSKANIEVELNCVGNMIKAKVESEKESAPLSQVEGCLHIERIDICKWPKRKKPFVGCLVKHTGLENLFVKNLAVDIEIGELKDVFGVFGRILSCKIAKSDDRKSKSFGYVQFDSEESVVLVELGSGFTSGR